MSLLDRPRKLLYEWNTRRNGEKTLRSLDGVLQTWDPMLLVHQMGRAGSMTTVNTLRASELKLPIFHTHWLNPASVKTRQGWVRHLPESRRPLNVRVSGRISTHLQQRGMNGRNWKLVSVFREPVARNVSVFFLAIEVFLNNFQQKYKKGEIDFQQKYKKGEMDNQQLLKVFLEEFPHNEPLDWFNDEIKEVFGLDVLEHPFPREQGYQIIRSGNVDLLLLKLEQLDACHQEAFQQFLGVDIPELKNTHVSELDPSKPMYADFVKNTLFPGDYLDRMYTSDVAQHFYSKEEISSFRQKWSGKAL
jgi:Putative capsular polysaccharide synthesis protein